MPNITDNVELLVYPFGRYEVEAISDDLKTYYIIDSCGLLICDISQIRKITKQCASPSSY